jgi:hypothetical protein
MSSILWYTGQQIAADKKALGEMTYIPRELG